MSIEQTNNPDGKLQPRETQEVLQWTKKELNNLASDIVSNQVNSIKQKKETEKIKITDQTNSDLQLLKKTIQKEKLPTKKERKPLTKSAGTVTWPSGKETYYNLPMNWVVDSLRRKWFDGEFWVRADGVKMYGKHVMVAAPKGKYKTWEIIPTTLWAGIVCDTGAMKWNRIDIAVNWSNKSSKKKKQ